MSSWVAHRVLVGAAGGACAAVRNSYAITCTAWARLREGYSGLAGMRARALQRMMSLFERPAVSLPKTTATSSFRAARRSSRAAARASSEGWESSRSRALKATEYVVPASASSRLAHARADSRRSSAPERSEEHTSELQSQSNLVCRLLLEKKKKSTYSDASLTKLSHANPTLLRSPNFF